ncbi:MAG: hypothetical protein U0Y82_01555 [Thermoleophilia bacterium]
MQSQAGAGLTAGDFHAAFLVCGLCGLAASVVALAIPRTEHQMAGPG